MAKEVKLDTTPSEITKIDDVWLLHLPRFGKEGTHYHTYGLLTPYFEGLTQGRLMATRCVNKDCPVSRGHGEMWLPPRNDCPDCHRTMEWQEVKNPEGYIYSYTFVERGGTGLEVECPYYQIDVKIEGVCTILKGYLLNREPIKIGDKVKARFREGDKATRTCLDIAWELT
jgi:uncharacterized OB-fold protein